MSTAPEPHYKRIVEHELDILQESLPAIAIEGAKGVGKTLTAVARSNRVFRLDEPEQLAIVEAAPRRLVEGVGTTLIDEWQRYEASWDLVRRAVDDGAGAGSFLLAGSSSPLTPGTHSGAGRIVTIRMRPLSLAERGLGDETVSLGQLLKGERPSVGGDTPLQLTDYLEEITRSGFPGIRRFKDRALRAQLTAYTNRIVDRELPELGYRVKNPSGLMRWMRAYAAAISTTTSFEKLRLAAEGSNGEVPAKPTTAAFRDSLTHLWVLEPIPAWHPGTSAISRLSGAVKHQLVDPALATTLLGETVESLLDPPGPKSGTQRPSGWVGALFESLVTQSMRVYAQHAETNVFHLRTHRGEHEIDLILERRDGRILAIEIKLTATPSDRDVRHLNWLEKRIGDRMLDKIIITAGGAAYRRSDGVAVVPAALIGH